MVTDLIQCRVRNPRAISFLNSTQVRIVLCHRVMTFSSISLYIMISALLALSGDIHPNPGPSSWKDLSICHTNIRSIRTPEKMDDIRSELADNFDIITLSESWLHSSCDTSHLDLAGFQQVHRKDRSDDSGYGGVLAWVSTSLVTKRRLDLEIDQLELMWLEIRCNNNKFLMGVVYQHPMQMMSFGNFTKRVLSLLRSQM